MSFYHEKENAEAYAAMCEGYDASAQLKLLYQYLPEGSAVLELGSGPGNDLELLLKRYDATGSDYSPAFIEMLQKRFPENEIVQLDAVTIEMSKVFDAVYSNKVLHHLSDEDLKASFARQAEILNPQGYAFHLIWKTLEAPKEDLGVEFHMRNLEHMKAAMGDLFEIVDFEEFCEFDDGDSLAILTQKK